MIFRITAGLLALIAVCTGVYKMIFVNFSDGINLAMPGVIAWAIFFAGQDIENRIKKESEEIINEIKKLKE